MVGMGMRMGMGMGPRANIRMVNRRPKSTDEVLYELRDAKSCSIWLPDIDEELIDALKKNPEGVYSFNPQRFEKLVASIFRNQGFDIILTPETKDGGYDIIAVNNDQFTGSKRFLVECKRYKEENRVGVGIVRGLYGVVCDENATKGLVVTSSYFTKGARNFETRNIDRLALHDYSDFSGWIRKIQA